MKKFLPLFLFIFIQSFLNSYAQAQTIVRGPYLQSPGQTSIIIRWRTDSLTDSRVNYGATITTMPFSVDSSTLTTEHRVKITGLTARTKYFYSVGSTTQTLRGPDTMMFFVTAPDTTVPTPVRLWAIGDFGHGNAAHLEVRDSYLKYSKDKPADLWLWLGDNAYQDGTDSEFQSIVFDSTNGYHDIFLNVPFAATSGNHDYNSICPWNPGTCMIDPTLHTGPYLDLIDPPTHGELGGVPSNLKLFYSFDYGDIHFISLNSEIGSLDSNFNWLGLLNFDSTFTSPMLDWLKADIASTTKKWKIAFWHQCPYSGQNDFTEASSYQFYSIASRTHFNRILEKYDIDLVITGHDHNYQRSYLINGHYGYKSTYNSSMTINGTSGNYSLGEPYIKYTSGPMKDVGTVYVVEGNSSEGNDYSPISHPAIYWGQACNTCFGSFIVDIDGDRLDGHYLTSTDSVLDEFTIIKSPATAIEEEKKSGFKFSVYPNPFSDNFTVEIFSPPDSRKNMFFELYDLPGKLVLKQKITGQKTEIRRGNLPAGTYFYKLFNEKEIVGKGKLNTF